MTLPTCSHFSRLFLTVYVVWVTTVQDGQKITKFFLGEHKVITSEQQFLGLILCFFMYLEWPWLLRFFAKML